MFIAKNEDLIILAKDTKEELEQALQFMVYTSIEETDVKYELYNGEYLTPEEVEEKKIVRRIIEIENELVDLDKKRIRAICEPSYKTEDETWLEYYNKQVNILREELKKLQK